MGRTAACSCMRLHSLRQNHKQSPPDARRTAVGEHRDCDPLSTLRLLHERVTICDTDGLYDDVTTSGNSFPSKLVNGQIRRFAD